MPTSINEKISKLSPERQQKVKKRALELIKEEASLRELREMMAITQKEMAETLHIGQEGVSRIEKRSDMLLSTLRKYIEAIGGDIDLVVSFPNRPSVILSNFSDLDAKNIDR
ncbi:MAG: helix-turn-helix transcriptional regulator [Gammaproteobacteria bacterium]|nr:helix-turn-helix transcriptional regulator [Gammaproteobacteria bacterium]